VVYREVIGDSGNVLINKGSEVELIASDEQHKTADRNSLLLSEM